MERSWENTVSMHFVRVLKNICDNRGLSPELMLQKGSINAEQIWVNDARISATQLANALENMWEQSQDEFICLTLAPVPRGCFALAAKYCIQAKTLSEALFLFTKFYSSVTKSIKFTFTNQDTGRVAQQPSLNLRLEDAAIDNEYFLTELLMVMAHRFSSWLIGQFIPLERVEFNYTKPEHANEYQLMYACPMEFEKTENSLIYPGWAMNKPIVQTKNNLKDYLNRIPGDWFRRQIYHQQAASSVVKALHKSPQFQQTQISDIASSMNITERTLRRRLTQEGTSYQVLKDNLRRDRAIELLAKTDLTVAEIAAEIGFTEPNAFTRAFNKWTGSSPKTYRL